VSNSVSDWISLWIAAPVGLRQLDSNLTDDFVAFVAPREGLGAERSESRGHNQKIAHAAIPEVMVENIPPFRD
jgi:hypothetical protein